MFSSRFSEYPLIMKSGVLSSCETFATKLFLIPSSWTRELVIWLKETASSLLLQCHRHFHRADIIVSFLQYFEQYYEEFLKTEDLSGLLKEYNAILVNMGKIVRVLDPKEPFEGKAMGITKKGELIVDTWESRKLVSSGEVSVRGIYGYV